MTAHIAVRRARNESQALPATATGPNDLPAASRRTRSCGVVHDETYVDKFEPERIDPFNDAEKPGLVDEFSMKHRHSLFATQFKFRKCRSSHRSRLPAECELIDLGHDVAPPLSSRSGLCAWDYAFQAIALNRIRSVRSDGVTRCHPIRGDLRTKEGNLTPRLLAATKFSPPALPNWHVPRHRLHAALDASANLPLTVVVGAPGAGKSVVLVSWLRDRPELASIWLSCDARDADPATFWSALTNALVRRWPDRWLDATDLLSEAEPALGDVAVALVNDLATLGEPVVIVIDDFQFASAAAPSVTAFIERLPSNCRVVIGSRTEPQLALYRLRAHGQLLEVRDADLRFTQAEVAAVMLEFGIELNAAEVELLTARTEGWAAGVQMAAVSLRDESVPDLFLTEFEKTPRSITDFLGSEVLERQPAEILDFLLATSVLEHLDADSCMAVTERRDAGALLERVEERHLFLIELARGTYRYHHLFSDLLRHRLHADDPDREHALHRRAAEFFIDAGDIESAFGHFLMAGEEAEAFELLRSSFVDAYIQGDGRVLHRLAAQGRNRSRNGRFRSPRRRCARVGRERPCRAGSAVDHPRAATAPATSTTPTVLDSCSRERSLGRNTEKPTRSNERCPTMADQRTSRTTKSLSTDPSCSRAPGCGSAISTAHANNASTTWPRSPHRACSRSDLPARSRGLRASKAC